MPNKLTDTEIKKALECCIKDEIYCDKKCAGQQLEADWRNECRVLLMQNALDLINHQEKENKSLKAEVERLKANEEMAEGYADALVEYTKAEAYKEAFEKVKRRIGFCDLPNVVVRSHIDNLLNELIGE